MNCNCCGENFTIRDNLVIDVNHIICPICGGVSQIATETLTIGQSNTLPIELPVLEEGRLVLITNKEHPWYNEIALICDRGHKSYRIEVNGSKLWVPPHWVEKIRDE